LLRLTPQQASVIQRTIRQDPVWFAEHVLGVQLMAYQKEWLRALTQHRLISIKTCHGVGKSFFGAIAALWFLYAHPWSEVITTAPTKRQVVNVLWKEIRQLWARARIPLGGDRLETGIKVRDGWFAVGFTSENADRFQGLHAKSGWTLVIADEAAGIEESIFLEGIAAVLSSEHAQCLLLGNPTSDRGHFRESFTSTKSPYACFSMNAFDSPNFQHFGVTREDLGNGNWQNKVRGRKSPYPHLVKVQWAADRLREHGPTHPIYQARVEAEFPSIGEKGVFPAHWIDWAIELELPNEGPRRWGVDPGGSGQDPSIVMECLENGRARVLLTEAQSRMPELVIALEHLARVAAYPPEAIHVDSAGVGAGLCELLRVDLKTGEPGYIELQNGTIIPVYGIHVGSSPTTGDRDDEDFETYKNLRAELTFSVRRRAERGELDISRNDSELITDMKEIQYFMTDKRSVQIESKEHFRDRTNRSPDRLDAMMLGFAHVRPFDLAFTSGTYRR